MPSSVISAGERAQSRAGFPASETRSLSFPSLLMSHNIRRDLLNRISRVNLSTQLENEQVLAFILQARVA